MATEYDAALRPDVRRRERERRYQAVLDSIERLEYELGLSAKRPTRVGLRSAAEAERRWRESASAKATSYVAGFAAGAAGVEPRL